MWLLCVRAGRLAELAVSAREAAQQRALWTRR